MTDQQPYWVYVLWSPAGQKFYIGLTDDLERRLAQHNSGESKWTRRFAGSWQLAWTREFPSLRQARKFENLLKRQKGGDGFRKITGLDTRSKPSSPGS